MRQFVCLFDVQTDRTIRNEYVPKNKTFKMTKVPEGHYKIRVLYGNDWNPTLSNNCGTKGNFESNKSFSEFDKTHFFEDSYNGYTIASITLYTVSNGNATTSSIRESDFFN